MRKSFKPLESILVKPAGPDCNLGCKYCFYLDKSELYPETNTHRMSEKVLEELIRQTMEQSGQNISFAWQGGEPTLMGLDFFKKAVHYEKVYGNRKIVGNGLQTNGILLNEEWADFLKQFDFLVGLSLDGPQHIHDNYRLSQNEKPSWKEVMKSAKMLLDRDVPVNAMCCITSYSANYAREIYEFFKSIGLTWMQFIPIVETDKENPRRAAEFSVTAEQYGQFLIDIFDLWVADFKNGQPTTNVRFIESVFHTYVGMAAPECTLSKECGVYVTVEYNGDVYSCDFFVEPKWKLGNLMDDRLIDMLNSPKQKKFGQIKSQLPRKCRTCQWYQNCFGGCTKDRIKDPSDSGMPRFCKSTMMFMEHADPVLSQLARQWKEQQKDIEKGSIPGDTYNAFGDFVG